VHLELISRFSKSLLGWQAFLREVTGKDLVKVFGPNGPACGLLLFEETRKLDGRWFSMSEGKPR
jgi:hypothetical protein